MAPRLTIAVDAMGGDQAPGMVVRGLEIAHERHPNAHFLLFGDEKVVSPLLSHRFKKAVGDVVTLHHTPDRVADTDKPSVALRAGRNSSMRLAIDAVADGRAAGQALDEVGTGEDVADQAHMPFGMEALTVKGRNAAGFLPPVLQGVKPQHRERACVLGIEYAEHTTLQAWGIVVWISPVGRVHRDRSRSVCIFPCRRLIALLAVIVL